MSKSCLCKLRQKLALSDFLTSPALPYMAFGALFSSLRCSRKLVTKMTLRNQILLTQRCYYILILSLMIIIKSHLSIPLLKGHFDVILSCYNMFTFPSLLTSSFIIIKTEIEKYVFPNSLIYQFKYFQILTVCNQQCQYRYECVDSIFIYNYTK